MFSKFIIIKFLGDRFQLTRFSDYMTYVKVAKTVDIPQGTMKHFEIEGNEYLIANIDGVFYSVDNRCTHFGSQLSNGTLIGRVVICPKHHASFDVITGKSMTIHTPDIPVHRVETIGDDLLVDIF